MGLISRIRERWTEPVEVLPATRAKDGWNLSNPSDEFINFMSGGLLSDSGIRVSPQAALKNMGLYAAIKTITEPLSHMPIPVIDTSGGARASSRKHPVHRLLNVAFNDEHTAMEGREMLLGHYILRGNGFAQILRDKVGRAAQLWPLHPDRMRFQRIDDKPVYIYTDQNGTEIPLLRGSVLHLRNLAHSDDGVMGTGFLTQAANALGLSIATEKFASKLYQNGARPSGILKSPTPLKEGTAEKLRKQINEVYGGIENFGKMAILEGGLEWQKMGLTAEESQIIESRKFQIEDIARGLNVPGHKVGLLDKATFSNIEHQSLEFVIYTLMAHARRFEMTAMRDLFSLEEQTYMQLRYNFNSLVRGDMKTRYDSYAVGRQWGWLSVDDIRALEDMDELPEGIGKIYLIPLNMIDARRADEVNASSKDAAGAPSIQATPAVQNSQVFTGDFRKALRHSFLISMLDCTARLARKETKAVENALKQASLSGTPADFSTKIGNFYRDLERELPSYFEALAKTFAAAVAPGDEKYSQKVVESVLFRAKNSLIGAKNSVILQDFSQPDKAYANITAILDNWRQERGQQLANELVEVLDPDVKAVMTLCAA